MKTKLIKTLEDIANNQWLLKTLELIKTFISLVVQGLFDSKKLMTTGVILLIVNILINSLSLVVLAFIFMFFAYLSAIKEEIASCNYHQNVREVEQIANRVIDEMEKEDSISHAK